MEQASVWIAPIAALVGTLGGTALGAWLLDHYSGKRWLRQQHWATREKHYTGLLTLLTKIKISLQGQNDYYIEPGSEHRDYSSNEHFMQLGRNTQAALNAIQELIGPARVYLSQRAVEALEVLVGREWDIARNAAFPGEYVETVLELVRDAEAVVLSQAKTDLATGSP